MELHFNIKQLKKELSITDKDIAGFFGYKNKASYYHASRRKDIEQGMIHTYLLSKNIQVAICCGSDASNVDGTDMRCLSCGEIETDIVSYKEWLDNQD